MRRLVARESAAAVARGSLPGVFLSSCQLARGVRGHRTHEGVVRGLWHPFSLQICSEGFGSTSEERRPFATCCDDNKETPESEEVELPKFFSSPKPPWREPQPPAYFQYAQRFLKEGKPIEEEESVEEKERKRMREKEEMRKKHRIVLLGDGLFNNSAYEILGQAPAIVTQLRYKIKEMFLPWKATLLGKERSFIPGLQRRLPRIPNDASVLVIGAGRNDCLLGLAKIRERNPLYRPFTIYKAIKKFATDFHRRYAELLDDVTRHIEKLKQQGKLKGDGIQLMVCTLFYPQFDDIADSAIAFLGFSHVNSVILSEAAKHNIPVIDLASIFENPDDIVDAIAAHAPGGDKLTNNILQLIYEGSYRDGHAVYNYKAVSPPGVMYVAKKQMTYAEEIRATILASRLEREALAQAALRVADMVKEIEREQKEKGKEKEGVKE